MIALNLLVFRAGQRRASGHSLQAALVKRLESLLGSASHDEQVGALLLAGELECAVADAAGEGDRAAGPMELLTEGVAERVLRGATALSVSSLLDSARAVSVCEDLHLSAPEGFAYYALNPLGYAQALDRITPPTNSLMVVGIRSIGTTLSAVTTAAARLRGMEARRITVRPEGHPYHRCTEFSRSQLAGLQQAVLSGATFVIVDEGPGLSGSSFLSVAEALERVGAPRERIMLLGGHEPNVDGLCAADAARRWRRFRYAAVAGEARRPLAAVDFIGAGQWRNRMLRCEAEWPASWTSFERLKYLSAEEADGRRLFKFAGFGHYGDPAFAREQVTAESGFGTRPRQESDGFISYPWIDGRPLSARDLSPKVLSRLAEYCAFRAHELAAEPADLSDLQQMAEHNLDQLKFELPAALRMERPVIADGRMQPHEWLLTQEGGLLKTDSGSHGDDHFFPGVTDIAWDLAGAMVEWRMNKDQGNAFLDLYRRAAGDDAGPRVGGFITAYAAFRCAYSMMAAEAMQGSEEQPRLERAADGYRLLLAEMKPGSVAAA